MRTLDQLLAHCAANNLTMNCAHDDPAEPDYVGLDAAKAKEALEACDCMHLRIMDADGKRWGYAFIVTEPGQAPEEQISDHTCDDRLDAWMQEGADA